MILIGGENLIDYIQEPVSDGYPVYRAVPGGSPYNTAKAASRQGVPVGYLTPFSDDSLGQLLQSEIAKEDLALLGGTSTKPTTLAVVSLKNGQATYQFYRENTAERDIDLAHLTKAIPADAQAFYVGSLALSDGEDALIWASLFKSMKARGLFCALDPNIRAAFIPDREGYLARLNDLIAVADMVKLSDEDLEWIAPGEDLRAATRGIFDRSAADLVVLTMGDKGAFAVTAAGEVEITPNPVENLIDTVGAGDTFMGSLLAQTSKRGLMAPGAITAASLGDMESLLQYAARAAAINCTRKGCNPPTSEEVEAD